MFDNKKSKTMPVNVTSLWDAILATLDIPNGTVSGVDGTNNDIGKLALNSAVNGTVTNLDGSGDDYNGGDVGGGFWWEEVGASGNTPIVKFGPDPGLLRAIGVYGNFIVFVAAVVLAIGVVCRCVAAKVRISLNRRSGPEIAFMLGAVTGPDHRPVDAENDDRRDGHDGERDGYPNRHTV